MGFTKLRKWCFGMAVKFKGFTMNLGSSCVCKDTDIEEEPEILNVLDLIQDHKEIEIEK